MRPMLKLKKQDVDANANADVDPRRSEQMRSTGKRAEIGAKEACGLTLKGRDEANHRADGRKRTTVEKARYGPSHA